MRRLKLALEACGVHVDLLTTRDAGDITWQAPQGLKLDEEGVVAWT
jgi:hypothetical protein